MKQLPSPCTDRCGFDRDTGWCQGCFRMPEEIRDWKRLTASTQRRVIDACSKRKGEAKAAKRRQGG